MIFDGLKLEGIAALAMSGLLANPANAEATAEDIATKAVAQAKALTAQLDLAPSQELPEPQPPTAGTLPT